MSKRARTIEEFRQIHHSSGDDRGEMAEALKFRPRPTDVIISPFGKSGTTWLQQMFHTLRSGGDTDYDDISRVVPWIETSVSVGIDLDGEQKANPRGYKSHLGYDHVPKGCRYIVSLRDLRDVAVSLYHFMVGWYIEPDTVGVNEFVRETILKAPPGRDYASHLNSWWAVRHEPTVLLMTYESMRVSPEDTIRRVASHIGVHLTDDLLALTLERTSLEWMLANKDKFDDLLMRQVGAKRSGLPLESDGAKVRSGKVGSHGEELDADVIAALDAMWAERVQPVLGFENYEQLRAALEAEAAEKALQGGS